MNCDDIERLIQPLLDDLLPEGDYLKAHAHIEGCPKCRQYASAIGSFSYVLKELGEIEAPRGLPDSVLFHLKNRPAMVPSPPAARSKKFVLVSVALVPVMIAAVYFGFHYFRMRRQLSTTTKGAAVADFTDAPGKRTDGPRETELFLEKLGTILGAQADREPQRLVPDPPSEPVLPERALPFHWHFPHSAEAESRKMQEILKRLGADDEYALPELALVSLSPLQFVEFVREMESASPHFLPVRGIDFEKLASSRKKIHLSIYLEKNGGGESDRYHWHIPLPPASEFRFFEVFRRMGIRLDYDSPDLVVLTILSTKVGELVAGIRSIEGISAELVLPGVSEEIRRSYPVRVSIYLGEEAKNP